MSSASQQVFTRIVLRNKLLSETEVDSLLAEFPEPRQALEQLVQRNVLTEKTAEQFWTVYERKLDQLFAEQIGLEEEPPTRAADSEEASPEPAARGSVGSATDSVSQAVAS